MCARLSAAQGQNAVRHFSGGHADAELDLLILRDGRRPGFDVKLTKSPQVMVSMRSSKGALELGHLYVVCQGEGDPCPLAEGATAVPAACLASEQWLHDEE